jgi:hypothetical protein
VGLRIFNFTGSEVNGFDVNKQGTDLLKLGVRRSSAPHGDSVHYVDSNEEFETVLSESLGMKL